MVSRNDAWCKPRLDLSQGVTTLWLSESAISIRHKPLGFCGIAKPTMGLKSRSFATPARGEPDEKVSDRRRYDRRADSTNERPTHLSTATNERLQHSGKRHERRRPQTVHEFVPKRGRRRNQGTALHKREAVRQFLHRPRQGLL